MTDEKKAALQGGFSHISHSGFSIASHRGKAEFDSIAQTIVGGLEGDHFIRGLRERYCEPDALFRHLQELVTAPAKMRGFCRGLQKFIERGAR